MKNEVQMFSWADKITVKGAILISAKQVWYQSRPKFHNITKDDDAPISDRRFSKILKQLNKFYAILSTLTL